MSNVIEFPKKKADPKDAGKRYVIYRIDLEMPYIADQLRKQGFHPSQLAEKSDD